MLDAVVGADHADVAAALVDPDRPVGHEQRRLGIAEGQPDPHEHPGHDQLVGVGQFGPAADCAGRGLGRHIDEVEHAPPRKALVSDEGHLDGNPQLLDVSPLDRRGIGLAGSLGPGRQRLGPRPQDRPLVGLEVDIDRFDAHDGRQRPAAGGVSRDEVAGVDVAGRDPAVERRNERAELEVEACLGEGRLGLLEHRPRHVPLGHHDLVLLAGDHVPGNERGVAAHLPLEFGQFRRLLVDLGRRLVAGDLVRPLVDREERLSAAHPLAVDEVDVGDKARHPGPDVDLLDRRGVAGEDDILGHVPGHGPGHANLRRRQLDQRRRRPTAAQRRQHQHDATWHRPPRQPALTGHLASHDHWILRPLSVPSSGDFLEKNACRRYALEMR